MRKYKSGVRYQKSKNAWLSVFIDNNNNYRELYFSVSKYGEEAELLAKEAYFLKKDIRENRYIEHNNYYEILIRYKNNWKTVYIDKDDYERVSQHRWRIHLSKNTMYAISHTAPKLHRFVLNAIDENKVVDHINRNGLDNRKSNLREVDISINNRNTSRRKDNKSGIIGVFESGNQWRAKWYDENGKQHSKAFSKDKYGYEEAKQMAINFRVSMMKQYNYVYDKDMYGESSETIESK